MADAKPVVAHIIYYGGERHKTLCWGPPRLTTADTYDAYDINRIIPLVAIDSAAESKVDKIMDMVRELVRDSREHTGESTGNLELQQFCIMDELRELAGLPEMQPSLDLDGVTRPRDQTGLPSGTEAK